MSNIRGSFYKLIRYGTIKEFDDYFISVTVITFGDDGGDSTNNAISLTPEDLRCDLGGSTGFYDSYIVHLAITNIEK